MWKIKRRLRTKSVIEAGIKLACRPLTYLWWRWRPSHFHTPLVPLPPPSQCNDSAKVLRGSASETSGPACDCGLSHCFIVSFTVSLREDQSLLKFADCLSVTLFHWVSAVRIYMSRDRLAPWQSAGFRTSAARGPRTSWHSNGRTQLWECDRIPERPD